MNLSLLENPQNLIAFITALVCFFTVMSLAASAFRGGDKLEARLKSVANRREQLRKRSRQQIRDGALRHNDEGFAKTIVDKLDLKRLLEDSTVVDKLAQAGYRGPQPVSTFYLFRFISPFVLGFLAFIYLFVFHQTHFPLMQKVAIVFGGLLAGYYAPNMYIKNAASKRQGSIMQVFPDALDLLLICVEAGMSIESAIHKVAQEVGSSSIELAEELSLLTAELSYLPERRMAYEGLARRTNNPGIKAVTTAMIQAERYGTPLGTALRVMAKENRDLRLASAEKKAGQLPAKLTVPMIVFFLPALFIVIMGPAVIKVQDSMKPGVHASNVASNSTSTAKPK